MMNDTFATFHPCIQMLFFCMMIGITVFTVHPVMLAISFCSGIACFLILTGWRHTIRTAFLYCIPVAVIVALMNPLFNHYGVTILGYLYNGNAFTLESCAYGLAMGVLLMDTMIWFFCFSKVITSDRFIYLFGRILPAVSLVLSMSMRFIPRFAHQMKMIQTTQKTIGKSDHKILAAIQNLSILITWAFERAIATSDSMRSRGYGQKGRTAYGIYSFDYRDGICGSYMILCLLLILYGAFRGNLYCSYNPEIIISNLSVVPWISFGCIGFAPVGFEIYNRNMWKSRRNKVISQRQKVYRLWEVEEND